MIEYLIGGSSTALIIIIIYAIHKSKDDNKIIKLPQNNSIKLKEYLKAFDEKDYVIRKKINF